MTMMGIPAVSRVSPDRGRGVIRGPASILYGSNAMGGVINIITKKQTEEGFHGTGHFMYGSYNTQKYMLSGGYKKGNLSLFTSINHDHTDGHRPNSDFSITNGYVKLGYEVNRNIDFSADLSLAHFNAGDPGPDTLNAVPGNKLNITRGYWALTLNNNYEKYSGTAKLFFNFGEHEISDGFHSNDKNYGINIFETVKPFTGNTITAGIDYLVYGGNAENEIFNAFITDTSVYDAGVYGFMQQTFFKGFTVNAGLRLQKHKTYGTEWIPAGGFAWRFGNNTTWKLSVGKGFRSPTLRELFVWNHNINLRPETIINYETGLMHTFAARKIKLELTGFIVNGKNLIISVPMQGLLNAGEVSNKGIEFMFNSDPLKNLSTSLTYSFTDMKYPVYATPRHNLFVSCEYQWKKLRSAVSIQHIDHLDSDPLPGVESFETYTLLNGKIIFQAFSFADLFLNAENILNQKYVNNIYYTMPGITVFAGVKLKI